MAGLPINLEDLLYARGVEDVRRELKAGWDDYTAESAVRTICAFANDILNMNGGYLIIGVEENDQHRPILPPVGVDELDADRILREIAGQCRRITPEYQPAAFVEKFQGRTIIVLRAAAGETRPYQAPSRRDSKEKAFYVRFSGETIEATGDILRQVHETTARIPFDDRRNHGASLTDISPSLVRRYLTMVGSQLAVDFDKIGAEQVYRQCGLTAAVNGHEVPRNVALLMFNEEPHKFFRGAVTEVSEFPSGPAGNDIREQIFRGPLPEQLRQTMEHLRVFNQTILRKRDYKPEVDHIIAYPEAALAEALANAYYHRSYDVDCVDPTVVEIHPDRIEIVSYPGPVLGTTKESLLATGGRKRVTARNRRIGELFKELKLTEQRFTGIPKILKHMEQNGSPPPEFDFDEFRSYFRVVLRAHPEFQLAYAFHEADKLESAGERSEAVYLLNEVQKRLPGSPELAERLLSVAMAASDSKAAFEAFDRFRLSGADVEIAPLAFRLVGWLIDGDARTEASRILELIPQPQCERYPTESANLFSRSWQFRKALPYRELAVRRDPRNAYKALSWALDASQAAFQAKGLEYLQMLGQAEQLLEAVLLLPGGDLSDTLRAQTWSSLANHRELMGRPKTAVIEALSEVSKYAPDDPNIRQRLEELKASANPLPTAPTPDSAS